MKVACEFICNTILPLIRALIAKEAVNKFGMKQKDVARKLGLTNAAISQYLKGKRGGKLEKRFKELKPFVYQIAKKMSTEKLDNFEVAKSICKVCIKLRASLTLCKLHRQIEPELKKCTFCSEILQIS